MGHVDEHPVAGAMAIPVIDGLEPVDINDGRGGHLITVQRLLAPQFAVKPLPLGVDAAPVEQPCQRITLRGKCVQSHHRNPELNDRRDQHHDQQHAGHLHQRGHRSADGTLGEQARRQRDDHRRAPGDVGHQQPVRQEEAHVGADGREKHRAHQACEWIGVLPASHRDADIGKGDECHRLT
ncbi:Uncharacterised protein [Mycobacteroides abscessus subsp. abscessus]|nr:Uncharacterised protein [Mycobacteroides abscessus subsp. abscessus]